MTHWNDLESYVKKRIAVVSSVIGLVVSILVVINYAFAYDDRIDSKIAANTQQVLEAVKTINQRLDSQIEAEHRREIRAVISELSALEFKLNEGTISSYERTQMKALEERLKLLRDLVNK